MPSQAPAPLAGTACPTVRGKFVFVGDEKCYVRGVTYGPFRPDASGNEYHDLELVERDFAQMASSGVNAVRTYTLPPRWLLDAAQRHGLRVMVGLPWEQHVAFLNDRQKARSIQNCVRTGVRACAQHPALLAYVIGNEIPAAIVRWSGRRQVERFLKQLYETAKEEDPEGLVTYVNYPSTEYLELPFIDFLCFNVYLEATDRLEAYLARLQNLAGERPLVLGEIGLDSNTHGEYEQAHTLRRQVRTAFAAGCAGVFVFAWTDEWHRGGYDIEDWAFGITDAERRPKPAFAAVRKAFAEVPYPPDVPWPRVSVVVCSHNGERTIHRCLKGLQKLNYPDFEVIVVDDGSTDATVAIAHQHGFRVISTENRGLSSARNTGLAAASGEIVAYIDDDAWPDPDWLTHLAAAFLSTEYVGIGGPNIPPADDGLTADCVANAPGGPIHVLLSDREAEHIPGCNMAFRKTCLQEIGGFDPQFRIAGDDVDICWRLQERGWKLGFSPAAVVWHRRRSSVRAYWRQQQGYGKAEALLEKKWPGKYNSLGHLSWTGRLYGKGLAQALGWWRRRIYHGTWGSAPFQSVHTPASGVLASLPLMPEWYPLLGGLAALLVVGVFWKPLLLAGPLFVLGVGWSLAQAATSSARVLFLRTRQSRILRLRRSALTMSLHLVQPLARLLGRWRHGLTPWRHRRDHGYTPPTSRTVTVWSERWRSSSERLQALKAELSAIGADVRVGGDYDRWDMEVRSGLLGSTRIQMLVEEHGAGRQLVRLRSWPRCSIKGLLAIVLLVGLATGAALDGAAGAAAVLAAGAAVIVGSTYRECASSTASLLRARPRAEMRLEACDRPSKAAASHEDIPVLLSRSPCESGSDSTNPAEETQEVSPERRTRP